MTDHSILYTYQ